MGDLFAAAACVPWFDGKRRSDTLSGVIAAMLVWFLWTDDDLEEMKKRAVGVRREQ